VNVQPLEALADFQADLLPAQAIALPNPLVYLNIASQERSVFRHRLMTANAARIAPQPGVGLYRYPPGTLVDGDEVEPYATLAQGILVRQQIPDWVTDFAGLEAALAARGAQAPVVQAPCLLVARFGDATWGHWVCEMLSKIVLAESVEPRKFTYVVPARITRTGGPIANNYVRAVLQSLHAYGIEPHRLLRVPPHHPLRFDALFDMSGIFPVPGERFFGMHPGLLALMQTQLKTVSTDALPTRPYITRRADDTRQIANADAVLHTLRGHGYTQVDIAGFDFDQQVRLFRQANSVAGVLGSGLTGLIYAPPELPVLTLAPQEWRDMYFVNMFQKKRVMQVDIRGISTCAGKGDVARCAFSVPVVDIDEGMSPHAMQPDAGAVRLGASLVPRQLGIEIKAIDFGAAGNSAPCKQAGWASGEAAHCWSLGPECSVSVPHDDMALEDCWLVLQGFCFNPPGTPMKELGVAVNGVPLGIQWLEGVARPAWLVCRDVLARQNPVSIRFFHPVSPSPRSVGVSDDDRALGFAFVRLAFVRRADR
jgi:hypothetical protein